MALIKLGGPIIKAIGTCVPSRRFNNLTDSSGFDPVEARKVVLMAGVKTRHLADDTICSSDLCFSAARNILDSLHWAPETIDGLIMVTQSPDYFLPSTACLMHQRLGLPVSCASFDVGLGCSGYPYGLWLASMMLQNRGFRRVLLLHGETPSRFSDCGDRSVALLFGDAGSATALEAPPTEDSRPWWFNLYTDGTGCRDLIIEGGGFRERFPESQRKHFVSMNGANIFSFTIKRVPALIEDTLREAGITKDAIDYYIFHQSNQFIMRHLANKVQLPEAKIPFTIGEFGSTGGPSIPLTLTRGNLCRPKDRHLLLLLLGYGVGLSWGSAVVELGADATLSHSELSSSCS
jgi:3-oxoacyl-[acyl-carrier-protein] synthase-3